MCPIDVEKGWLPFGSLQLIKFFQFHFHRVKKKFWGREGKIGSAQEPEALISSCLTNILFTQTSVYMYMYRAKYPPILIGYPHYSTNSAT